MFLYDLLKIFFFLIFEGHESFLWGHWYPYFGLLVTSPLGFKARVGSALFELSRGIRVMLHVPWDSPSKALVGLETGSYHAAAHSVRSGRPDSLPTELSRLGQFAEDFSTQLILNTNDAFNTNESQRQQKQSVSDNWSVESTCCLWAINSLRTNGILILLIKLRHNRL